MGVLTSPSVTKNIEVVLVPYSHMEVRPYSYFQWCGYFWGPLVSFVMTVEFLVRVTKITSRIGVSCLMALLSKACKPDNFELHNSLKPTFRNIWGLCLNFVDCESFLESKSLDILALSETKLDGSMILAISLWEVIFLWSERIPGLICMVLQFMWRKDFLLLGTYL